MLSNATGDRPFGDDLEIIELIVGLLTSVRENSIIDAARYIHPEIHTMGVPGIAPGGRYENREEFLKTMSDAASRGVRVEPDASQIRVLPARAAIASGSLRVTGPAGADVMPAWFVYTVRDGLIDSLSTFLDRKMAEEFVESRPAPVAG